MVSSKWLAFILVGIWSLNWDIIWIIAYDQIIVPVAPGTDVGVGFGELSPGPHSLEISLEAISNYRITKSYWFDPSGEHIWSPKEITRPDPKHMYMVYGVFSNEAYAVKFHGFLAKTPGEGPPPEFYVAVGDIDLDVDSDNDSTDLYRSPSGTQEEDEAEYIGSSTVNGNPPGMAMSSGAPWAKMKIKAHVKRAAKMIVGVPTLYLNLESPQWQFAQFITDHFSLLTPREGCEVEGCGITIYESQVNPGEHEWTLYIKPDPTEGSGGEFIVLTAALLDQGGSSTSSSGGLPIPIDRVVVKKEEWAVGGSNLIVVVDADGVYEDEQAPANMKKLVIHPPSEISDGTQFRLKQVHPERQLAKIRVFYKEEGKYQEVTFTDDWSDRTFSFQKLGDYTRREIFFLKGKSVPRGTDENPWASAPEYASDNYEDQGIEVYLLGEDGKPESAPVVKAKQTALWVSLTLDTAGDIPPDNDAIVGVLPPRLGLYGFDTDGTSEGIKYRGTIRGTVKPSDLVGHRFRMKRLLNASRLWFQEPNAQHATCLESSSNCPDDSFDSYVDEDPHSGGSHGVIYDLDMPGFAPNLFQSPPVDNALKGSKLACRMNFTEWVELNGERCSERFPWYVALAGQKTQKGTWTEYQPNPQKPDNIAGRGHIPLGWDLEPFKPFVSLIASPRIGKDGTRFQFTATWQGEPNFDYAYEMQFHGRPPWQGESTDIPQTTAQFTSPPLRTSEAWRPHTDEGQGKHILRFVLKQKKDGKRDEAITTVYTNQEPRVKILWEVMPHGKLRVKAIYWDADKDPMSTCEWRIIYFRADGSEIDNIERTNMLELTEDILHLDVPPDDPQRTRLIDIMFRCKDTFGNMAEETLRLTMPY